MSAFLFLVHNSSVQSYLVRIRRGQMRHVFCERVFRDLPRNRGALFVLFLLEFNFA